jgi:hypothetical protein
VPYFTRQVAPNGNLILVASVGVSQARRQALIAASQPVPNLIIVQALVDTGASCTCIDPFVLGQLNLSPTGITTVNTPSTGTLPATANQYDVAIMIQTAPNLPLLIFQNMPVLESQLLIQQGFHMLLGRDILRSCLLLYDGMNGLFSLAY